MTNKNILITVLVILVIGFGVWYVKSSAKNVSVENSTNTEATTSDNQVSAKINIDAVCQGALAYMTFPDSASADAFVSDCKAGKHPEVIERYKADMNLGDGAKI